VAKAQKAAIEWEKDKFLKEKLEEAITYSMEISNEVHLANGNSFCVNEPTSRFLSIIRLYFIDLDDAPEKLMSSIEAGAAEQLSDLISELIQYGRKRWPNTKPEPRPKD